MLNPSKAIVPLILRQYGMNLSTPSQIGANLPIWPTRPLFDVFSSMPEIPVGAQIFDVVFHPTFSTVYTGLLTGHVKAFSYDSQGNHKSAFSVRPSKKSCRGLSLDQDGSHLYAVGKGKALRCVSVYCPYDHVLIVFPVRSTHSPKPLTPALEHTSASVVVPRALDF